MLECYIHPIIIEISNSSNITTTTTNAFVVRFPILAGLDIRKVRKQWYICVA